MGYPEHLVTPARPTRPYATLVFVAPEEPMLQHDLEKGNTDEKAPHSITPADVLRTPWV